MKRISIALAGLTCALVLSACGSSGNSASPSSSTSSTSMSSTTSSTSGTTVGLATSCTFVTAAAVSSALGVTVSAPTVVNNAPVTVCYFPKGSFSKFATVRLQTNMTSSSFATGRAGFGQHGEPTSAVNGLGEQAYSSVIGSGKYAISSIVVLNQGEELLISAPATLAAVESLARSELAKF